MFQTTRNQHPIYGWDRQPGCPLLSDAPQGDIVAPDVGPEPGLFVQGHPSSSLHRPRRDFTAAERSPRSITDPGRETGDRAGL